MAKEILCFELNSGAKILSVGLGTWQSEPGVVGQAVEAAIKIGYRHIDCARAYNNEKEIGAALKKLFDDGFVKREDLFITSKLWCTDHAPEDVSVALGNTLEELQLEYVDLYLIDSVLNQTNRTCQLSENGKVETIVTLDLFLKVGRTIFPVVYGYKYNHMILQIHWQVRMAKGSVGFAPENLLPSDIRSTWKAMEALYDSGKARPIGVSNFSTKLLGDLLSVARIPPAVNQVECHPSWQQPKLKVFCKSKGVHLSGYSPLGSPGSTWLKSELLKHHVLVASAEKLGKTPAQVAFRWGLQMGHSILPKSTNESRIKEFDVFNWSVPNDLFVKFSEIQQASKIAQGFVDETLGEYKTFEALWDGEI